MKVRSEPEIQITFFVIRIKFTLLREHPLVMTYPIPYTLIHTQTRTHYTHNCIIIIYIIVIFVYAQRILILSSRFSILSAERGGGGERNRGMNTNLGSTGNLCTATTTRTCTATLCTTAAVYYYKTTTIL